MTDDKIRDWLLELKGAKPDRQAPTRMPPDHASQVNGPGHWSSQGPHASWIKGGPGSGPPLGNQNARKDAGERQQPRRVKQKEKRQPLSKRPGYMKPASDQPEIKWSHHVIRDVIQSLTNLRLDADTKTVIKDNGFQHLMEYCAWLAKCAALVGPSEGSSGSIKYTGPLPAAPKWLPLKKRGEAGINDSISIITAANYRRTKRDSKGKYPVDALATDLFFQYQKIIWDKKNPTLDDVINVPKMIAAMFQAAEDAGYISKDGQLPTIGIAETGESGKSLKQNPTDDEIRDWFNLRTKGGPGSGPRKSQTEYMLINGQHKPRRRIVHTSKYVRITLWHYDREGNLINETSRTIEKTIN